MWTVSSAQRLTSVSNTPSKKTLEKTRLAGNWYRIFYHGLVTYVYVRARRRGKKLLSFTHAIRVFLVPCGNFWGWLGYVRLCTLVSQAYSFLIITSRNAFSISSVTRFVIFCCGRFSLPYKKTNCRHLRWKYPLKDIFILMHYPHFFRAMNKNCTWNFLKSRIFSCFVKI